MSFSVGEGDFAVLCGFSGSGKTTLLRLLKPELSPKGELAGSVLFKSRDIKDLTPKESASLIGFVSQSPENQNITGTVLGDLAFGLENLGLATAEIRRRVAETAAFFGLGKLLHKKTDELSGGQKQILNLASVIIMQPQLLLLDEPTAWLDPVAAQNLLNIIMRLNTECGVTIIVSEHRLDGVLPLASKTLVLKNSRLEYTAAPRELADILNKNGEDALIESLPAASKIYSALGGKESFKDTQCPLTVREGRALFMPLLKETAKALQKPQIRELHEKILCCKNLYFKYKKENPDVLNGLSFESFGGEMLAVIGENGCGKSTLLSLLAGVLKPVSGKILYYNNAKKAVNNGVAFLPQNPKALFLCDTVGGELGDEGIKIAKRLGLDVPLYKHPYDLSVGEMQKAAIAKLLTQKPTVLLLDEPTRALDAAAKLSLAAIIKELKDNGTAVIVSTHDLEFASSFADRCLFIADGAAACEGEPRSFFNNLNFYTTAAARISRGSGRLALTCGDVIALCKEKL